MPWHEDIGSRKVVARHAGILALHVLFQSPCVEERTTPGFQASHCFSQKPYASFLCRDMMQNGDGKPRVEGTRTKREIDCISPNQPLFSRLAFLSGARGSLYADRNSCNNKKCNLTNSQEFHRKIATYTESTYRALPTERKILAVSTAKVACSNRVCLTMRE